MRLSKVSIHGWNVSMDFYLSNKPLLILEYWHLDRQRSMVPDLTGFIMQKLSNALTFITRSLLPTSSVFHVIARRIDLTRVAPLLADFTGDLGECGRQGTWNGVLEGCRLLSTTYYTVCG